MLSELFGSWRMDPSKDGFAMLGCSWLPRRGEDLNDPHSTLVAHGTDVERFSGEGPVAGFPVEDLGIDFGEWSVQEQAAKGEPVAALAVGKEAEVSDLGKTVRKNMEEKPADELVCIESHGPEAVVLFAVSPPKRDLTVVKCYQSMIGNRNPMGVAAEIIEDLSGTAEGRFGVNDPFVLAVSG